MINFHSETQASGDVCIVKVHLVPSRFAFERVWPQSTEERSLVFSSRMSVSSLGFGCLPVELHERNTESVRMGICVLILCDGGLRRMAMAGWRCRIREAPPGKHLQCALVVAACLFAKIKII
jgi:hypothetical protein